MEERRGLEVIPGYDLAVVLYDRYHGRTRYTPQMNQYDESEDEALDSYQTEHL